MTREKRPHSVERPGDPHSDIFGVQPVGDQQGGQQIIGCDPRDQIGSVRVGQIHDTLQSGAVQLGDELQQLDRLVEHAGVGTCLKCFEALLDGLADGLFVDAHAQPRSSRL